MGVVYRAEDLLLRRAVALKVLTGEDAPEDDSDRRWLREAQSAAALNHPSVCMIYEAGEIRDDLIVAADGTPGANGHPPLPPAGAPYLTMELIEGRTLSDLIREAGALPLEQVFAIAIQVAEGLAAAHARGIVHRDLKPGNVMLTEDGQAKILDFGLARQIESGASHEGAAAHLDTRSRELIREGRVRGTLAYLSPERALGKRGESQSDIFSFGVLLYEMASGARPFQGETTTALLAKILEAEPMPPVRLRPDLPAGLARIIARCLRKKPEERYNDTRDLVAALREARDEADREAPSLDDPTGWVAPPPPRVRGERAPSRPRGMFTLRGGRGRALILGGLCILAAAAWITFRTGAPSSAPQELRTTRITWSSDIRSPAISPDGNFVAFVRTQPDEPDAVVVQDLRSSSSIVLFRGGFIGKDLAFSPDGSEVAFSCFSPTTGECKIHTVPLLGGPPKAIGAGATSPICWAPDGMRLAAWMGGDSIMIFDKASGAVDTLRSPLGPRSLEGMAWSPKAPLLLLHTRERDGRSRPFIIPLEGGDAVSLEMDTGSSATPQWAPDGKAIYAGNGLTGTLTKLPVDGRTGKPRGRPAALGYPTEGGRFGISGDGRKLVYERSGSGRTLVRIDVARNAGGRIETAEHEVGLGGNRLDCARIAPDGTRLAAIGGHAATGASKYSLVITDLDGAVQQIVTSSDRGLIRPVWAPDGSWIAYLVTDGANRRVATADLGTGRIRVFETSQPSDNVEWTAAGRIVYQRFDNMNYIILDPRTGEERPLLQSKGLAVWQARPSIDGRWLAFARTIDRASGMSVWLVSLDSGAERPLYQGRAAPVGWSTDGRRVFLVREDPDRAERGERVTEIVSVPIDGGPVERVCAIRGGSLWSRIDVSPDGRRVVYTRETVAGDAWVAEGFDPEVGR